MPREKAQVEAALLDKGFVQTESHHHFFVYHTSQGLKTRAKTKTSHTPKMKDIPDNLLKQMARQCFLTTQGFLALVDCPMSQEEYEGILVQDGIVVRSDPSDQ